MTRYLLIPVDGVAQVLTVGAEDGASYATIRDGVGGLIQAVDLAEDMTLWIHDEGKLEGLPHNPYAQALFDAAFGPRRDYVVGPAVLTGGNDDDGNTLGLTDAQMTFLDRVIRDTSRWVEPQSMVTAELADGTREVLYDSRTAGGVAGVRWPSD